MERRSAEPVRAAEATSGRASAQEILPLGPRGPGREADPAARHRVLPAPWVGGDGPRGARIAGCRPLPAASRTKAGHLPAPRRPPHAPARTRPRAHRLQRCPDTPRGLPARAQPSSGHCGPPTCIPALGPPHLSPPPERSESISGPPPSRYPQGARALGERQHARGRGRPNLSPRGR